MLKNYSRYVFKFHYIPIHHITIQDYKLINYDVIIIFDMYVMEEIKEENLIMLKNKKRKGSKKVVYQYQGYTIRGRYQMILFNMFSKILMYMFGFDRYI